MNGEGNKLASLFDAVWPPLEDLSELDPLTDFQREPTMDEWDKGLAMDLFDFDDWDTPFKSIEKVVQESEELKMMRRKKEIDVIEAKSSARNAKTSKVRRTCSSRWKGVTKHKITNKWETHLWDATYERPRAKNGTTKGRLRGRQVYLGGYETEIAAARVFDLGVLKYFGQSKANELNFPITNYAKEIRSMALFSKEEWVAELRRNSCGFSRGTSSYRGVTIHKGTAGTSKGKGRWEARIGRVLGNRYLYLGTFPTERAAAEEYDRAALKFRGSRAVTNFDRSSYTQEEIAAAATDAKFVPPPPPRSS